MSVKPSLELGLDDCWKRFEEGEGETTGNLAWLKEEVGTFGFPPHLTQLASQISFILSLVLLWGQLSLCRAP